MPHYLRIRRLVIGLTVLLVAAAAAFGWWRSGDESGRGRGPGQRAGFELPGEAAALLPPEEGSNRNGAGGVAHEVVEGIPAALAAGGLEDHIAEVLVYLPADTGGDADGDRDQKAVAREPA